MGQIHIAVFVLLVSMAAFLEAQENLAHFPKQDIGTRPAVLTGTASLSEKELQEGWIRLFDGVSLFGWNALDGNYSVRSGMIVCDPKKPGVLRYACPIANSEVLGERQAVAGKGDWTPFKLDMRTTDVKRAGDVEISLDSGQFRNVKLLPHGMVLIFDGKTLDGWKIHPECKATVVDGAILLTGGSGSIESEEKYDNFILQLEYKTDKPVNSGLFFRCIPGEKMNGYECQIFNNPPAEDYKKFIGTDTGGIFRRQVGRNAGPKDGQWNYLTLYANRSKIATWVNGIQVTDWTDQRAPDSNPRKGRRVEAGTIQFQGHDPSTAIFIRNIRIGRL